MRVIWTPLVEARLHEIIAYISEGSPRAAQEVALKLARRALELGDLPAMGRQLVGFALDEIRELLERPYRLLYRLGSDRIEVLAVLHYRQLMPTDLADLHG